ncbi:MAG: hypothetical protein V3U43_00380 [Pseudomonadales bacterium]
MTTLARRDVTATDWPRILELANASVSHVPGAGTQEEWYENRRSFDSSSGTQDHYVFEDSERGEIVGYGGVEMTPNGEFRMFIVTLPQLLETVGERLFQENLELAKIRGAERVWFTEYVDDTVLVEFAKARDFMELGRIRLDEGVEAITLMKRLS